MWKSGLNKLISYKKQKKEKKRENTNFEDLYLCHHPCIVCFGVTVSTQAGLHKHFIYMWRPRFLKCTKNCFLTVEKYQ